MYEVGCFLGVRDEQNIRLAHGCLVVGLCVIKINICVKLIVYIYFQTIESLKVHVRIYNFPGDSVIQFMVL